VFDIYLYSLDSITKEAIADIYELRSDASMQDNHLPLGAITLLSGGIQKRPEIRFDVSVLYYEAKHEMDIKIRKILKKHKIKFSFSNASNPKLNFQYEQKIANG
jgi:hypothetical protein